MRAAIFRDGQITVDSVPDPAPEQGQVIVKTLRCDLAEGRVDAEALITGTVGLDGVASAFAELANPERHAKVMIDPWR